MNERWSNAAQSYPCGKCPKCLKERAKQWAFRIHQEMKHSKSAYFITLTYNDDNLPCSFNGYPSLVKKHAQAFTKALKKRTGYGKLKYYICGEYGSLTARPHYHLILLNSTTSEIQSQIEKCWPYGHFRIDPCNLATIHYVTGYLNKPLIIQQSELDDRQKEFSSMSKGLGANYLTPQMVNYHKKGQIGFITTKGGAIQKLPRYYSEKIFTKLERQAIAAEMQEIATYNFDKLFKTASHELKYRKDQYRKQEKQAKQRSTV